MKWFREPLLHFAAAAAILFYLSALIWPAPSALNIEVSRATLLEQYQYQTGMINANPLARAFDDLSAEELRALVRAQVIEEVLYLEALKLGLDQSDRAIRLRLGQQAELFLEDIATLTSEVDESKLQAYFELHQEEFVIEASITFKHVFYDPAKQMPKHGDAQRRAEDHIGGDRFLYHSNYVERTSRFIEAHFGPAFTTQIFASGLAIQSWSKPIESDHGFHRVFITQRLLSRLPDFNEVRGPVLARYQRDERARVRTETLDRLIKKYALNVSPEIQSRMAD